MRDSIIMTKYQGFGNDYLVLDAKKNQLQLQGKKVALLCQRGFGLGADGVLYGPVDINGKMGMHILIPMEVKLQSVETVSVFLQNILWIMSMLQRKNLPLRLYQEQSK